MKIVTWQTNRKKNNYWLAEYDGIITGGHTEDEAVLHLKNALESNH